MNICTKKRLAILSFPIYLCLFAHQNEELSLVDCIGVVFLWQKPILSAA